MSPSLLLTRFHAFSLSLLLSPHTFCVCVSVCETHVTDESMAASLTQSPLKSFSKNQTFTHIPKWKQCVMLLSSLLRPSGTHVDKSWFIVPSLFSRHILNPSDIICLNVMEHSPFICTDAPPVCVTLFSVTHTPSEVGEHTLLMFLTYLNWLTYTHTVLFIQTVIQHFYSNFISFIWYLSGILNHV